MSGSTICKRIEERNSIDLVKKEIVFTILYLAQKPWIVNRLLTTLADLYDEQVMPQRREASDKANPKHHGGVWMPWLKNEVFDYTQQSYKDNFSMKETKCLFKYKSFGEILDSPALNVDLRKLQTAGQNSC